MEDKLWWLLVSVVNEWCRNKQNAAGCVNQWAGKRINRDTWCTVCVLWYFLFEVTILSLEIFVEAIYKQKRSNFFACFAFCIFEWPGSTFISFLHTRILGWRFDQTQNRSLINWYWTLSLWICLNSFLHAFRLHILSSWMHKIIYT